VFLFSYFQGQSSGFAEAIESKQPISLADIPKVTNLAVHRVWW